jgi:hypothetical protein
MKIAKHITFYYSNEYIPRIKYINRIIQEVNKYGHEVDIFIHTNNNFQHDLLDINNSGKLSIIVHSLSDEHPYYLTWKCRNMLLTQKDIYDIFIYIEDDMLIPKDTLLYWLENKDIVIKNNYNLGFIRIEIDDDGIEYTSDFSQYQKTLHNIIDINNIQYILNDENPYCAMWIYDRNEFSKFINSGFYNLNNSSIQVYGIREKSAIGLHGLHTPYYKGTILPIVNNYLDPRCKIYHMANNYINHIAKIKLFKNLCIL